MSHWSHSSPNAPGGGQSVEQWSTNPGSSTAPVGPTFENADSVSLNGTSSYVQHGSLTVPTNISVLVFVKASSLTSGRSICSKWSASTSERSFEFEITSTGQTRVLLSGNGTTVHKNYVSNATPVSTSAWNSVGFTFAGASDVLQLLTGNFFDTSVTKTTDTSLGGSIFASSVGFCLGAVRRTAGGVPGAFWPGLSAHLSIWQRVLTEAEFIEAGAGSSPVDLTTHSRYADLIHWFQYGNLDDTTATLYDYRGSLDGTGTDITISTDNP